MDQIYLWVDCLSINQADAGERHDQIHMMGHIFQQAYAVFGWLGDVNHDLENVLPRLIDAWDA